MENLKDQQIENQKAEIESQRRKIESLERELQRHLDPDSGEIRPSLHGEKALVQQIATQKQLDDCLGDGKIVYNVGLYDRLFNIIGGVLMPTCDSDTSLFENWDLWFRFRQAIFNCDGCAGFFSDRSFRFFIRSLNNIIDDLDRPNVVNRFDFLAGAAENLLASPNPEGWKLALEALTVLEQQPPDEASVWLSQPDAQNLRFSMQIIRYCVTIAEASGRDHEQNEKEDQE